MTYYPEPDSHRREKVKVVPDLTNYATKKELELLKSFVALKAEIDKLDNCKLVNGPTSLINLKTKVDDF